MAYNSGGLSGGAKVCLLFDNKHQQLLSRGEGPQVSCMGGKKEMQAGVEGIEAARGF